MNADFGVLFVMLNEEIRTIAPGTGVERAAPARCRGQEKGRCGVTKQGAPPSARRERGDCVSEEQGGSAAANTTKAHSGAKELKEGAGGSFLLRLCKRGTQIGHKLGTVFEKQSRESPALFWAYPSSHSAQASSSSSNQSGLSSYKSSGLSYPSW